MSAFCLHFVDFVVSAPFCPLFVHFSFCPLVYFLSTVVHFQFSVYICPVFKTFWPFFSPLFSNFLHFLIPFLPFFCPFPVYFLPNFHPLFPTFLQLQFCQVTFASFVYILSVFCPDFVRLFLVLCLYFVDFWSFSVHILSTFCHFCHSCV